MTASFFCPHKPRLWSQVGRCDYRYKILQTTWTEAPQHFLKTRVVLMLIIPVISSSYLPQHRHHRNPLMKPLKSPWYNSMICGWTLSKFLILSHCFIRVNILLIKSYDMIILQIYINFTLKCYYNHIFGTWQRGFHEGLKLSYLGGKYSSLREVWNLVPAHGNRTGKVMWWNRYFAEAP